MESEKRMDPLHLESKADYKCWVLLVYFSISSLPRSLQCVYFKQGEKPSHWSEKTHQEEKGGTRGKGRREADVQGTCQRRSAQLGFFIILEEEQSSPSTS